MFAATVLATYDNEFYNDYKGMIEMMIRDYAGPSDNDSEYCRFRAYDMYEGHSWQADTQTMIQVTIRNQPVNHYLAG